MVLSEVMFNMLEKEIAFWHCQFSSIHEATSFACFAYGCQAVMCRSFINECILHLAGHAQGQQIISLGKKEREDVSMCQDSYFWKFVGMFAVLSKDQAFSWKTEFLGPPLSPYSWCVEADSLQPVCREPNQNSHSSTEVNILSQRSASWTAHTWTHAHIVLSSSLWGQAGRGVH